MSFDKQKYEPDRRFDNYTTKNPLRVWELIVGLGLVVLAAISISSRDSLMSLSTAGIGLALLFSWDAVYGIVKWLSIFRILLVAKDIYMFTRAPSDAPATPLAWTVAVLGIAFLVAAIYLAHQGSKD